MQYTYRVSPSQNLQSDKKTFKVIFNDGDLTVDALLKCSHIYCKAYEEIVLKNVHRIFPTQRSVYAPDGVKKIKLPH